MIYRIAKDGYQFKEPDFTVDSFINNFPKDIGYIEAQRFSMHNISMKSWWQKISFHFENVEDMPPGEMPDICIWNGPTLILSEAAYQALNEMMEPCGEFLELESEGQPFFLFNCLRCVDAIEEQSEIEWFEGEVFDVRKLTFAEDAPVIFKSRHDRFRSVFCNDEFREQVKREGFYGVVFDERLVSDF